MSAIERLPNELLDQISSHLTAYSALALRQTSRTLATKVPLDNNFWRNSILGGNALPYLWDLDVYELEKRRQEHSGSSPSLDATWDWKAVGQLLAAKQFPLNSSDQRIVDLPNGLWNRQRIWSIIEEAYQRGSSKTSIGDGNDSVLEERKRREPVFDWQLEEIMDDLGHFS